MIISILICLTLICYCYAGGEIECHDYMKPTNSTSKIRVGLIHTSSFLMISMTQEKCTFYRDKFLKLFTVVGEICANKHDAKFTTDFMEKNADIVIDSVFPIEFYNYFKEYRPFNLAMSTSKYKDIDMMKITWSDKKTFKTWMLKHKFHDYVPRVINKEKPEFPCVIKPRYSSGSNNVMIVSNKMNWMMQLNI